MEFNKLFNESIVLWPNEIDISDGSENEVGILFKNLSDDWDAAEIKAKPMGDWYDLMTWIIFANLHGLAKQNFRSKNQIVRVDQIDLHKAKIDLLDNLQMDAYVDMLAEFKRDNLM